MANEVTRHIKKEVERELWARAAGRCQFNGCNRLLYKSPVTQETVNISEKAHIYSFSERGPRGWGPFQRRQGHLNDVSNLMLMCHDCHKTIDQDKAGLQYSSKLLLQWKREHENRVLVVTGIASDKKSHVVTYSSNIGEQKSPITRSDAVEAMFPNRYPAEEMPIDLSMQCSHEDKDQAFWQTEDSHLKRAFERDVDSRILRSPSHFSLFAIAPMPLLIRLGSLFTDKIDVNVYQPIREPKTWNWQSFPEGFEFIRNSPKSHGSKPVLIISISDKISSERIFEVMGEDISVWELTVDEKHLENDVVRSPTQLSMFRNAIRQLMVEIKKAHGINTSLYVFPAMPISCSIEMGRARMPKADMPWVIYDHNSKVGKFIPAITIGDVL